MRQSTASLISAKIQSVPDDAIISARDMMLFGTTGAVYNCLSRLFKADEIVRICRGLYMKNSPNFIIPSADEILKAKRGAFGATTFKHVESECSSSMHAAGSTDSAKAYTDGCSSEFTSIKGLISIISQAPRKRKPGEDVLGFTIRSLWQLTRAHFNEKVLLAATAAFTTEERIRFRQLAGFMPWWISNVIVKCGAFPLAAKIVD